MGTNIVLKKTDPKTFENFISSYSEMGIIVVAVKYRSSVYPVQKFYPKISFQ